MISISKTSRRHAAHSNYRMRLRHYCDDADERLAAAWNEITEVEGGAQLIMFCGKIVWWRKRFGCGAFFAFQEMRCWQKWWMGFRAGCEVGWWAVVSPVL